MTPTSLAHRIDAIQNTAEVIAQSLREMIYEAELKPGQPLIQERIAKLSTRLAAQQTPLFIVHLVYRTDRLNEAYQSGLEQLAETTAGMSLFCHSSLREDKVTEADQRAGFQAVAPAVEQGLYLVPKVIE